jgi:Fic family protein
MLNLDKVKISPQTLRAVSEIEAFKGEWAALERHTTTLQTLGDVAGFGQKFKQVIKPWQNKPLTEEIICTLHSIVTGGKVKSTYREKSFPLIIQQGGTIIGSLDTAEPEDIADLMSKLVPWVQDTLEQKAFHPLLVIALFTTVFLQISPFEKGNHRLVRLLIVLLMFKAGYTYAPYAPLDHIIVERSREYHEVLVYTQETLEAGKPDWEAWLQFFLYVLQAQKEGLETKIASGGDSIDDMPELSGKVLKLFEDYKRLSMKQIITLTKGRRSTLKLRIGELVDQGYLKRHGHARNTWYARV